MSLCWPGDPVVKDWDGVALRHPKIVYDLHLAWTYFPAQVLFLFIFFLGGGGEGGDRYQNDLKNKGWIPRNI